MIRVQRDYSSLLAGADSVTAMEILKEWTGKSPDNKKLKALTEAVLGMVTYIHSLQHERMGFDHITDEQNDKILSCRKKIAELEAEIKRLNDNIEFLEELQR